MPELGNTRYNTGNGKPDFSYVKKSTTVDINSSISQVSEISDGNNQRICKLEAEVTVLSAKLNAVIDQLTLLTSNNNEAQ